MKTRTKRLLRITVVLVIVVFNPITVFLGSWYASSGGSDRGYPELAAEWRSLLGRFEEPDSASAENKRIWVIHCDNGEWIFGVAQGSHGLWRRGGGTVVTKDSNGDMRSCRGHVCSPYGSPFEECASADLAAVYKEIDRYGFSALSGEPSD